MFALRVGTAIEENERCEGIEDAGVWRMCGIQFQHVRAQFTPLMGDRSLFSPELPFAQEVREFNTRSIEVQCLSCPSAGAPGLPVALAQYQCRFPSAIPASRFCRGRDGSASQFSGFQGHYGDGYGPCIRPREDDGRDSEIDCKFGPGFLVGRRKPVQAFSSPICAEAKVEFRQCLNGTMLGSYQYPNCQ